MKSLKTNKLWNNKLYTEEQVREVVRLSLEDAETSVIWSKQWYPQKLADIILQSLQPIELPTDEEIKEEVSKLKFSKEGYKSGVIEGMIWMRDKIQGGKQ